MTNKKTGFSLVFPENLKRDANLSTTNALAFDDLGDFIEEREKIKRTLERSFDTDLKVDYSDFENHVFFDSAVSKFNIAKKRILENFPFNGDSEEKDAFHLTGSGYEDYIFEQWPRFVGYLTLNGSSQYVSASDSDNKLLLGSSSLYVSAWIKPTITSENVIVQHVTSSNVVENGFDFILSGASDPHLKFVLYSGSAIVRVSASYAAFTGSWNNVAAIYDRPGGTLSLYINDSKKVTSSSLTFGPIDIPPTKLYVGSGSANAHLLRSRYAFYSGSINEVRVLHTASDLFHTKNYSRPIDAEDYVALHYKFNDSITETGSIDSIVVDYSKNGLHGKILDYSSGVRVSGSVMVHDPGDPILYSFHSSVVSFTSSLINSASFYDVENNNQIFNLIPGDVLQEDDRQEGLLRSFSLALARYFDEIKLHIDQFDNLRVTNYDDVDETPDIFLPTLTRYFGWNVTEHFENASPLEFFYGENVLSTGSLNTSLLDVRNQFWRRILNNMPYLLQTKGKRSNLDSFFNVLGVNRENINIKEYGYLPGGSIEDTRIHKEKVVSLLGIGTGSLSGSYVKVPLLITSSNNSYTIESFVQLPYVSASYSGNLTVLTGSLWQFVDPNQVTGSFALLWNVPSLGSSTGKFILTSSDGQKFSSSNVEVFDGDFVHVAAGLKSNQIPFIEVRTLDNDTLDLSQAFTGAVALSGVFTGSKYDFIMGATSGSFFTKKTQGFFGEYRVWSRALSSSELDSHALHFENVGISDPAEVPYPLVGHWPLNENISSSAGGIINKIQDMSRNGHIATGSDFVASYNSYDKFLLEYNYLSPSIDLKWSENKVRVRNKNELRKKDIATDTNEVSLEFNLIDSLNRDISKIFSTIDLINNAVGRPINKYRDEYADLEAYRRLYFDRLGDSLHFNSFFNLFKWFDKKISDSIKQLLPARVRFVGGEQVVESHFLERPRYGFKYPIFRTPVDIPDAEISGTVFTDGKSMQTFSGDLYGTQISTLREEKTKYTATNILSPPRESAIDVDGLSSNEHVSRYDYGDEGVDRIPTSFYRTKYSGDQKDIVLNPNTGINNRNEIARKALSKLERENFDGYRSGSFVNDVLGNGFVIYPVDSSKDNEHYFGGHSKTITLSVRALSGTSKASQFTLNEADNVVLTQSLYDANNVLIVTGSGPDGFTNKLFGISPDSVSVRFLPRLTYMVSCSNAAFNIGDFDILFKDSNSDAWAENKSMKEFGIFMSQSNNWFKFESQLFSSSIQQLPMFSFDNVDNCYFELTCSSANTYVFADIRLDFEQPLSDSGVSFYETLDNQNNEEIFSYINLDVLKKVE